MREGQGVSCLDLPFTKNEESVDEVNVALLGPPLCQTFCWAGSNDKKSFVGSPLFSVLSDAIRCNEQYRSCHSEVIRQTAIEWFHGTRDRYGGRAKRRRVADMGSLEHSTSSFELSQTISEDTPRPNGAQPRLAPGARRSQTGLVLAGEEASNSWGSSSPQSPLMGGIVDRSQCATIHDALTGSADELHEDVNTNMAAPSSSPVHFDEAIGPANDVQIAENRGMLNTDHCVIIQGLAESSASSPRGRIAADLEQFQKLLNEMLQPTEDVTVLKAFRLVYRPPRNDPDADAQLLEELRLFSTRPTTLIVGDFNAPHIDWSSASADCCEAAFDQQLLRTSDNLLLTQHVMFPTRVREGQQMNCFDLVFTKSSDNIDVVNCLPPLGQSDYVVLMWEYTLFSLPAQPLDSRPNIWRGDFEQMKKDLSPIDWASTLSGDVEEAWCQFKGYIRQGTRNKDPVPLLRTAEGVEISDDKDKAEHLSQFFRSVVTSEPAFSSPAYEDDETPTLEAVFFTETIVRNELLNLKESTSPGPDAIPAKMLKELASEMSKPLALIFQTSFVTGCLPSGWKSATITPLFKGGSRNYVVTLY
nr:unnamed protein product [Spirometra erinaceieuropaei]